MRVTPSRRAKSVMEGEERVEIRLGDVASLLQEGLLALRVTAGLAVVRELVAADLDRLCGPRGAHQPARGADPSWRRGVVVAGRRAAGRGRPAAGADDHGGGGGAAGVARARERRSPVRVGGQPDAGGRLDSGTSKSAVSGRFCALTEQRLVELLTRPVPDKIRVVMIDGVGFAEHTIIGAIGIDEAPLCQHRVRRSCSWK